MSTIKVVTAVHPSSATNNLVLDSSGNVAAGANLTVTGTLSASGSFSSGAITSSSTVSATALIPTGSSVPTNGEYLPAANTIGWATNGTQQAKLDSSGNLSFNSGYGSVATAYGCRAWVNFNGTTASPSTRRGSGNVSSVTKNGTGDYTVNFTSAMPDVNYAWTGTAGYGSTSVSDGLLVSLYGAFSTYQLVGSVRFLTGDPTSSAFDAEYCSFIAIR
jgi:hypothetical protein